MAAPMFSCERCDRTFKYGNRRTHESRKNWRRHVLETHVCVEGTIRGLTDRLIDRVILRICDPGLPKDYYDTTLEEFLEANRDHPDLGRRAAQLEVGEGFIDGGGAAPFFQVTRISPDFPVLAGMAARWWDEMPIRTHEQVARWLHEKFGVIVDANWVAKHVRPRRRS